MDNSFSVMHLGIGQFYLKSKNVFLEFLEKQTSIFSNMNIYSYY